MRWDVDGTERETRQHKTRQDKTRQPQDKTRDKGKARPPHNTTNKTTQPQGNHKMRQDKERQHNITLDETKQDCVT
jgi:hypothetical protein